MEVLYFFPSLKSALNSSSHPERGFYLAVEITPRKQNTCEPYTITLGEWIFLTEENYFPKFGLCLQIMTLFISQVSPEKEEVIEYI